MNDSGEENNYISGNSEIISSKNVSSRGLLHPLRGSPLPEGAKGATSPNEISNYSTNPNLNPSLVAPFPSVAQRRQNRTLSARSRQQEDPFDWCAMLPPYSKVTIREGRPRESETRRSPRRQDAARPLGGGFKYTEMGLRFRASKARKPLPLWGIFKDPFRRKGP